MCSHDDGGTLTELRNPFPDYYSEFIYKSRYSRWLDTENRRENWDETVTRYMDFIFSKVDDNLPEDSWTIDLYDELWKAIYNLEIMPSMRAMMTAGPAAERDNTCVYNCSYLPIDDVSLLTKRCSSRCVVQE